MAGTGGDGSLRRIGVVTSGFAVRAEALDAGLTVLRRMGLEPVEGSGARARLGYLAGSDAARAADVQAVLDDPSIDAVWFARGGYGTARLLDRIDLSAFAKRPKLLLGYSDVTALFAAILNRTRTVCLHAPMVAELGRKAAFHAPSLRAMLHGKDVARPIAAKDVLVPGRAVGRLVGGNVTVLSHLLGTPDELDTRGAILFLEEVGEEAYKLDRLLDHLRRAGALTGARGVLVGHLLVPKTARAFPPDRRVNDVLRDHLLPLGVPVVTGFPAGHGDGKWTIPLGGTAWIDTSRRRVRFSPRPA
ncbi:MAG TPA: LD-carboxypeptidase [Candidatus Polarisedimenticolaceae bacterium]|nr:LD-carboxypeptidase [Candidatus Polarisedimenticolaceae bacterium]